MEVRDFAETDTTAILDSSLPDILCPYYIYIMSLDMNERVDHE